MDLIDLTKILKEEHQNKWVVYSPSKMVVLAFDSDPAKAAQKAKELSKYNDLHLTKVQPFDESICPIAFADSRPL